MTQGSQFLPEDLYTDVEGLQVAYQVVGSGPSDVVFVPDWLHHLDVQWEEPLSANFMLRLASFSRLIMFNQRGMGLSDPIPVDSTPTLEEWMTDLCAVMDAAGSQRAALVGVGAAAAMLLLFAATYPKRAEALVLIHGYARVPADADYPFGFPESRLERFRNEMRDRFGKGYFLERVSPQSAKNPRLREWFARYERLSASPGLASAIQRMLHTIDVRPILPSVQAPTLVIHRRDNSFLPVENGRFLAERIPGARIVELPGTEHAHWAGDSASILDEIQEFLTGRPAPPPSDRVLATVLFTDIVGSSETASRIGDRSWRDMLAEHDRLVRHALQLFGGREIKTMGDGFLATFEGPARAINCARFIRDGTRLMGLEIRAGLHTGEVEVTGDDVIGIAVIIAQRVTSHAQAGEVLVSRTVVDLVAGSGLDFNDRGEFDLKGVQAPWHLFALDP